MDWRDVLYYAIAVVSVVAWGLRLEGKLLMEARLRDAERETLRISTELALSAETELRKSELESSLRWRERTKEHIRGLDNRVYDLRRERV